MDRQTLSYESLSNDSYICRIICVLADCSGFDFTDPEGLREGPSGSNPQQLRLIRALKPLRIVKLLKAFKIVRLLKEELANMLGLTTVKMLALFGYLISSVHVCACGFWRAKLDSNTPEQLEDFMLSRSADPQARRFTRYCQAVAFGIGRYSLFHLELFVIPP